MHRRISRCVGVGLNGNLTFKVSRSTSSLLGFDGTLGAELSNQPKLTLSHYATSPHIPPPPSATAYLASKEQKILCSKLTKLWYMYLSNSVFMLDSTLLENANLKNSFFFFFFFFFQVLLSSFMLASSKLVFHLFEQFLD